MAKQIGWSPEATNAFEEICNYIARNSEYYAVLFSKRVNQPRCKNPKRYLLNMSKVDIRTEGRNLVVSPVTHKPRKGWEKAFKQMHARGEDQLLIADGLGLMSVSNYSLGLIFRRASSARARVR